MRAPFSGRLAGIGLQGATGIHGLVAIPVASYLPVANRADEITAAM